MIWFNIKALEKLLINGKVSDKLIFNYLFAHLILITLAGYLPVNDHDPKWAVLVHILISLVAIIWGVRKTFEINREGDGRDYFKRFISLSFVAGIRSIVFIFFILFFIAIGDLIAEKMIPSSAQYSFWQEVSELFGYLLFNVVYFYILITSFKRINSAQEPPAKVNLA